MKNYFKHRLNNLISVSKIVTIHYFEFDGSFESEGEAHDFWEIVYAEKGSVICSADGKSIQLEKGEILFHKPNEFHTLSAGGSAPNVFILSFVCKSEAMSFFEGKKIALKPHLAQFIYSILNEGRRTFDIPFSDPSLKKMKLLPTPTLGGEQLIKNYLEIFLINLLRDQAEEKQEGSTVFLPWRQPINGPVEMVVRLLEDNVFNSLTIDEICEKVAYNRIYLFRIFKAKTGRTIWDYYQELKINAAKQMLRENKLSVKEISERLAFNSPNYFTKAFKRITGLSPLAYKKRSASLS